MNWTLIWNWVSYGIAAGATLAAGMMGFVVLVLVGMVAVALIGSLLKALWELLP